MIGQREIVRALHYRGFNDPTGNVVERMGNPRQFRKKPHGLKLPHVGVRIPERPMSWNETHTPTQKATAVETVIFVSPEAASKQSEIETLVAQKQNGQISKAAFRHELRRLRSQMRNIRHNDQLRMGGGE